MHAIAVTSAANADVVREQGAEDVIDYTSTDTLEELRAKAADGVGGSSTSSTTRKERHRCRRPSSRVAGSSPGRHGHRSGPRWRAGERPQRPRGGRPGQRARRAREERGAGGPREELPLDRAAEALDRQATHRVRGKLVLRVA
jgi:hypothetical protein